MPLNTDAVTKRCIVNNPDCKLISKCDECNKEIDNLRKIDSILPGKPSDKKRGRPKTIIKSDIKIIPGPITVTFN